MSWHDGYLQFVMENGEPIEAQKGDEPTHVLIPIEVIEAHEAFHRLTLAQRNAAWAGTPFSERSWL